MELGAGAAPKLAEGLGRGPGLAVRACARDGIVGVGDVHDAGGQRNVIALQPVRVPATIGTLVMQLDDGDMTREERHGTEDARAERRMQLDDVDFLHRQRRRLAEHFVRHANLADVVEQSAQANDLEVVGRQLQHAADADREDAHTLGMTGGIGVARVECGRQGTNGTHVGRLGLRLGCRHRSHQIVERRRQGVELTARPGERQPGPELP